MSTAEEARPATRLRELWDERRQTVAHLDQIDREIERAETLREAEHLGLLEALMFVRSNAMIREALIEKGLMNAKLLDEAGYLSHDELDKLNEEGRLIEYASEAYKLHEALNIRYDPDLHPRDRKGQFRRTFSKVASGGSLHMPSGVKVTKHGNGSFSVSQAGKQKAIAGSVDEIADKALAHHDHAKGQSAVSKARPGRAQVPPRGRKGKATPSVLHSHPPESHRVPDVTTHQDRMEAEAEYTAAVEWVGGREPTAEEVAQDIDTARRIGLNDWPTHGEAAKRIFGEGPDTPFDTQQLHSKEIGGRRVYSSERKALHDQIVDTLLRQRKEVRRDSGEVELVPDPEGLPLTATGGKPRALFMAGGTASGKSSALALPENADVTPENAVHIDADEIKAMLPEYHTMIQGGDRFAASGVHEESSDIAKRLRAEAVAKGLNLVVDGTGNSGGDKFASKVRHAKEEGYDVSLFYVNAPTDVAVVRATKRAQRTGRWVPEPEVRRVHKSVSEVFLQIKEMAEVGELADIRGYHTVGDSPPAMFHLDENGAFVVLDDELYNGFIDKRHE